MGSRRAGALALGFTLAGVVLMLLLAAFAARVGPHGVVSGHAHDGLFHYTPPSTSAPVQPGGPGHGRPHVSAVNPLWQAVAKVIFVLGLVYLLVIIGRGAFLLLGERGDHRRRREPQRIDVDFDVLDDPEPLLETMREDADEQLALLLAGDPRNAIVACWDRFEEQAERAGAARRPWETSSEFTLRLLDAVRADDAAVARLEALFREARFSDHEITEELRQQAVTALRTVHLSVAARRAAASAGPAGEGRP